MKTLLKILALCFSVQINAGVLDDILASASARTQQQESSVDSGVEVIELLRVETPVELEAALVDGYPMPWLAEILADETIPEEDRYWIDCRMRAAIAQNLHIFFDRSGNPVHVEAEYIGPGEDYWREHLMVRPVGARDLPEESRPTRPFGGPGYILDLYGNRTGELADVYKWTSLSRDASVAATPSGGSTMLNYREPFACFMYPDGSFREEPFGYVSAFDATVSPNGELVVFRCYTSAGWGFDPVTNEPVSGPIGDAYIFDSRGNLLQRVTPPSLFSPKVAEISSDGRYIANQVSTGELFLIDCEDGYSSRIIEEEDGGRSSRGHYSFSPDGRYLCAGGFSPGIVISLDPYSVVWQSSYQHRDGLTRVHCSNGAEWISSTITYTFHPDFTSRLEVFHNNLLVYSTTSEGRHNEETVVSPNGHFLLTRKSDQAISHTSIPTVIRQIRREGSV